MTDVVGGPALTDGATFGWSADPVVAFGGTWAAKNLPPAMTDSIACSR